MVKSYKIMRDDNGDSVVTEASEYVGKQHCWIKKKKIVEKKAERSKYKERKQPK